MLLRSLLILSALALCAETAHAGTCSFDEASGLLSVVNGGALEVAAGGAIQLNGVACGAATTTTTARIVVSGVDGDNRESITLRGIFAPGRNDVPETDTPEIEIEIRFTDLNDVVRVDGDATSQIWQFTAGGINLNGDLDEDITLPPTGTVKLYGLGGNDVINASGYARVCARNFPRACTLRLYGGAGADVLTGSQGGDVLIGNGGNDTFDGGAGHDLIRGGPGADTMKGGSGDDVFSGDDGDDVLYGGSGNDDLDGGAGVDEYHGNLGDDVFYNLDGVAESVDCGEGIDDPEADALDTFIGCENI